MGEAARRPEETMRAALRHLVGTKPGETAHAGLVYERYAPVKAHEPGSKWEDWLSGLEAHAEPEGYSSAYRRWEDSLRQSHAVTFQARAESRLLVGHGHASPTGVGLTLHHTWGVPVVPGSSLKGVLAGYLRAVLGDGAAQARRRLFGVPGDAGARAQAGEVIFHDAQWVPGASGFLSRDVLTVHQKAWYGGEAEWPSDHDAPNPVSFLTVRPGGRFLVALSLAPAREQAPDAEALLAWAARRLDEALRHWGVGGKTAAGYGRLVRVDEFDSRRPRRPVRGSPELDAFRAWAAARRDDEEMPKRQILEDFEREWLPRLSRLAPDAREVCAAALRHLVPKHRKFGPWRDALIARMMEA
ncbi:type III-B CRISPR module RAMP protein Cmr6 [Corallococcus macrosporus]|uniref:Type III-B CRISPR module RAMP protein Cmr6 n=1 Tax=Corallococcus macrosporus DSM 14697 TaxID=1189310 RepID=A0A286NVZ1_9BACT|nr:type III-B CRISPR module RAMP protein Cmr6 [Corallococcus macrosporus]ATB51336.1 type III-B CRISPR module RAMP protein Cmr6 [Corallococcus macrosporus DSM 14697]